MNERNGVRQRRLVYVSCTLLALAAGTIVCTAQTESGEAVTEPTILPLKILVPAYPRLAQQARITGDVDLVLAIGGNGHVESVNLSAGHPILSPAAIESARRSIFKCANCNDRSGSYSLRYSFQINPLPPDKACSSTAEPDPPVELDLAEHQVTISAWEVWTCDPSATKIRSARCLYLWKCGWR